MSNDTSLSSSKEKLNGCDECIYTDCKRTASDQVYCLVRYLILEHKQREIDREVRLEKYRKGEHS